LPWPRCSLTPPCEGLSWTFVLEPLWDSTDLTTAGGLVALGYPFGDVVIVFFVVVAVRGMTREGRLPLWLLLGGLLAMALADSIYAHLVEADKYVTGHLVDSGWVVAYLGVALAAFCSAGSWGCLVLATTVLSLFDTYLLLTLMAE
jgi:diguanylate cyclase